MGAPNPEEIEYELFQAGIPRQCKHCGTWSRHERPKLKGHGRRSIKCFSVACPSCHKEFDVVVNQRGARQISEAGTAKGWDNG